MWWNPTMLRAPCSVLQNIKYWQERDLIWLTSIHCLSLSVKVSSSTKPSVIALMRLDFQVFTPELFLGHVPWTWSKSLSPSSEFLMMSFNLLHSPVPNTVHDTPCALHNMLKERRNEWLHTQKMNEWMPEDLTFMQLIAIEVRSGANVFIGQLIIC